MKPVNKLLLYGAGLTVLALVFVMYSQPNFLLMLANQVWGCF